MHLIWVRYLHYEHHQDLWDSRKMSTILTRIPLHLCSCATARTTKGMAICDALSFSLIALLFLATRFTIAQSHT